MSRRFQFSLRTLLVWCLMALIGALAWHLPHPLNAANATRFSAIFIGCGVVGGIACGIHEGRLLAGFVRQLALAVAVTIGLLIIYL